MNAGGIENRAQKNEMPVGTVATPGFGQMP